MNALVWRVYAQSEGKKDKSLSILHGRSMCPHCKHQLSALDLIPVLSWLGLRGKCRYCKKKISAQYPLVELATAGLFVLSYLVWPRVFSSVEISLFGLWLMLITGFMALVVYDFKWKLLPNRILFPLCYVGGAFALIGISSDINPDKALFSTVLGILVGGGIFYVIFQVSRGHWIGGGDVKLGWLLGAVVGSPTKSFLFIFLAALMGSLVSVPLLYSHKIKKDSTIPFGPFLIIGAIIAYLFGEIILRWYRNTFMMY